MPFSVWSERYTVHDAASSRGRLVDAMLLVIELVLRMLAVLEYHMCGEGGLCYAPHHALYPKSAGRHATCGTCALYCAAEDMRRVRLVLVLEVVGCMLRVMEPVLILGLMDVMLCMPSVLEGMLMLESVHAIRRVMEIVLVLE